MAGQPRRPFRAPRQLPSPQAQRPGGAAGRGIGADARGQQPPSLAAPGAQWPRSAPGNAPDGAGLCRPSRGLWVSSTIFSWGRNDRK